MTVALTALFSLYNERIFIYVSGYRVTNASWYKMVACDMYRIAVGTAGSLFFMMFIDQLASPVISKMQQNTDSGRNGKAAITKEVAGKDKAKISEITVKIFAALGRESLGIYVIQGYIILMFLGKIADPYYYKAYVIIPCAIITLAISYLILKLFGIVKNKLISIAHLAKHE
ncbi:MAG: hypothetical protein MJ107_06825 [Lachnospiraceae bacterium]|nr:hypothetical protein [Lachnospiraceae bacterium]